MASRSEVPTRRCCRTRCQQHYQECALGTSIYTSSFSSSPDSDSPYQRRFAFENPELLNIAENEHHSDSDPELTHVDPDDGPARKKRKKNSSRGRLADGECFWSRFEEYMGPLIQDMGSDMTSSAWKKYVWP